MKYDEPHLDYHQQLDLMLQRGMSVADRERAIRDLKRIGYYRLSGYTYPMRIPDHMVQDGKKRPSRKHEFVDGASFEDAVALHDFDQRLRTVLMDGLQQLEVGLRVRIGYVTGKHGPLAHLDGSMFPAKATQQVNQKRKTPYDKWRVKYADLQRKAKNEEYVAHFSENYGGEVPIWAAVEFMTMGCLLSLYELLGSKDQRCVAQILGVKDPKILVNWLKGLNILRNHCAHGNRIWNRRPVYPPKKLNSNMLRSPELLAHLERSPKAPVEHRVYFQASITAYLLRFIDPGSPWLRSFVSVVDTFPQGSQGQEALDFNPFDSMGFIQGWQSENLWQL